MMFHRNIYYLENAFKDVDETKKFCDDLFIEEPFPIFEHNYLHILSNLSYLGDVYIAKSSNWISVIVINRLEKEIIFFSPRILGKRINSFREFIEIANYFEFGVSIKNVSEFWIDKYVKNDILPNFNIVPRSEAEAVYDMNIVGDLEGKNFSNLRNARNKFSKNSTIVISDIDTKNFGDVSLILDIWEEFESIKYSRKRLAKERFSYGQIMDHLIDDPSVSFKILYGNNSPLGFWILKTLPSTDWAILYALKGLNKYKYGGLPGLTDYLYFSVFDFLKRCGIRFVNDGELGELGTRRHKMSFSPTVFLKSFDLIYVNKN